MIRRLFFPNVIAATLTASQGKPLDPPPAARSPLECIHATERGPRIDEVTEYTLRNGLKLLLIPDNSIAVTKVSVTYRVGSRHEGQGETGAAHLLEHMLFRGTPRHAQMTREFAQHGARYNATTTQDRTVFFETFPTGEDNLAWALDLEADRMVNARALEADLAAERTVVLREIDAAESNPSRVILERGWAAAFDFHPYGRSVSGSRADVQRITVKRLEEFYRRNYHPANAVVIIAGRYDERSVLALAESTVGKIAPNCAAARDSSAIYSAEPPQEGERRLAIHEPHAPRLMRALYHAPGIGHPDAAAIAILGFALSDSVEGPLARSVKSRAIDIDAALFPLRDPSLLSVTVTYRSGSVTDSVVERFASALDAAATMDPSENMVARARAALVAQHDRTASSRLALADALSEWIGSGDWRLFYLHRDRLNRITANDLRRVAKTYLHPSNRTLAVVHADSAPTRVTVPSVASLADQFSALEQREILRDARRAVPTRSDTWDGLPEHLNSVLRIDTLANGLRVAMLRTSGSAVSVRLGILYGSNSLLAGQTIAAAQLLPTILMQGPADMPPASFAEFRQELPFYLSLPTGPGAITARLETNLQNLEPALRMIARIIQNPRLDSASIERARNDQLRSPTLPPAAGLLARATLQQRLWRLAEGHPLLYTYSDRSASIQSVRVADVRRVYDELWSPSNMVVVVAGGFASDSLRQIVDESFGIWKKSGHRAEPVVGPFAETKAERVTVQLSGQRQGVLAAGLLLPLGIDSTDLPAAQIAAHILGSGLASRLAVRLREKTGISYTVFGSLESTRGGARPFIISANAAPENLQRVEDIVREELMAVARDGFSADEVRRAQEEMTSSWRGFVGQPSQTADLLADLLSVGREFSDELAQQRQRSTITADVVSQVVRKYFDPSRLIVVRVGNGIP